MCARDSIELMWCLYLHANGPAISVALWNAFPIGDGVLPLFCCFFWELVKIYGAPF